MNEQHIKEVFSDEEFVKSLVALETAEDAQKALKEKGVEMSVEELNEIRDYVMASVNENGELSLDALDDVAGGFITKAIVAKVAIKAIVGVVGGAALGAAGGAASAAIQGNDVGRGAAAGAAAGAIGGLSILFRW